MRSKLFRFDLIAFYVIIGCAALLRFVFINKQGFLLWDEGMYLNEALFYKSVFFSIPDIVRGVFSHNVDLNTLIENVQGWPPSSAKPLIGFLLFLFSFVVGLSPFTAQFVSALFGVASVWAVFILTKRIYGGNTALLAAFFTGISGFHIYLSRIGTPETSSAFFLLMGWYFYFRGKDQTVLNKQLKNFFSSGLMLGISFCLCYRWVVVLPLIWVDMFLYLFSKGRIKKNFVILSTGGFVFWFLYYSSFL